MPDVIPPSPEAKGLGIYGDIPVSTYTGVPNISIPIYTVKAGKLSLPITLSYHATGIEVSQEATWVGLGWNLIAGGDISYIPVGGNDQQTGASINWSGFKNLFDWVNMSAYPMMEQPDWLVGWWFADPKDPPPKISSSLISDLEKGIGEPDVYSANFLDYSFKFIKHPNPQKDSIIFLGQKNKCKIAGGFSSGGFVITGEDGTMYRFECSESNWGFITSWLLTKIINPIGDTITLKYKKAVVTNLPALSEMFSIRNGEPFPGERNLSLFNNQTNQYLDTIETRNELIVFETDTNRVDLKGSLRLTRIVIKDKFNQVEKLSYRFVYDYFTGSYVGGDYLNEGTYNTVTDDKKRKRLKLDSLIQNYNAADNEKYAFNYYEQTALPAKTSFAMDNWGYYNGQENRSSIITSSGGTPQHTIIPNLLPLLLADPYLYSKIPGELFEFNGAVRGASKNYITAGMLKSIQYPTKGKTVFEYEPNDFRNYKYISAEDEVSNNIIINGGAEVYARCSSCSLNFDKTEDGFTLNRRICVHFKGYTDFNDGKFTIEADDERGDFTPITFQYTTQTGSNGHVVEWDENIWLDSGVYKLSCTDPDDYGINDNCPANSLPLISGSITFKDYDENLLSTLKHIGGGVRIKKITNYDENNHRVLSKKYSYVDENGNTSGLLLVPLRNLNYKDMWIGHYVPGDPIAGNPPGCYKTECPTYTLYGSSYVSLSALPCGNRVGYDRVVESDSGSSSTNGKEISYFCNSSASLYFNKIPYFPEVVNGSLKNRIILNNNGDTVLTEKYNYAVLPGTYTPENLNAFVEDLYSGPIVPTGQCAFQRYNIYTYPVNNYWFTLTGKETTHYFPNGKVKETADYTYNPDNFCVRSVTESTSKGVKSTNFKYPVDYALASSASDNMTLALDTMKHKNMINTPIEKVIYNNGKVTGGSLILYKNFLSLVTEPYQEYKIETTIPLTESGTPGTNNFVPSKVTSTGAGGYAFTKDSHYKLKRQYSDYSATGNLLQYNEAYDNNITYLWGYNQSYPIAKVVNATQQDVAFTGFEQGEFGNWQSTSSYELHLEAKTGLRSIRAGSISHAVTKPSYVSLWAKDGTPTISSGVLKETFSTPDGWTYFKWLVSNTGTVTVNSNQGYIDDVRLYPTDALMTTYTYDPIWGMTSQTDQNGISKFYEYDAFGRLIRIRDADRKIIQQYDYHYKSK